MTPAPRTDQRVVLVAAYARNRVIGADGSLTGFGGGLALKRALLEFEGVLLAVEEE